MTLGEKEVAKTRANAFYRLKQGEFVVFFDGKDRKVRFRLPKIKRKLPEPLSMTEGELASNFNSIHREAQSIIEQ